PCRSPPLPRHRAAPGTRCAPGGGSPGRRPRPAAGSACARPKGAAPCDLQRRSVHLLTQKRRNVQVVLHLPEVGSVPLVLLDFEALLLHPLPAGEGMAGADHGGSGGFRLPLADGGGGPPGGPGAWPTAPPRV